MSHTKKTSGHIFTINGGWRYFIPAIGWLLIVIILSLSPSSSLHSRPLFNLEIPNIDKLVHGIFYGVLSFLILYGISKNDRSAKKYFWTIFIFCALLGLVLELIQQTEIINRHFDMLDIIANIIGALLGGALFLKFFKLLRNGIRN